MDELFCGKIKLRMGKQLLASFFAASVTAGICMAAQDIPDSKDHPLVKRMAGSEINLYSQKEYDEYSLFCAVPPAKTFVDLAKTKEIKRVEGKVTRIRYTLPKGVSILEAQRQYEAALKSSGFEILKSYGPNEINAEWVSSAINQGGQDWIRFPFGPVNPRWSCASAKRPGGEVFVQLAPYEQQDKVMIQVDVFEPKGMVNRMVDPDAATMAKQINAEGHVALYGIYFDTDKAVVKPESKVTLEQIAMLLKSNPTLKLSVVGHTDNAGSAAHNKSLSEARARAVAAELTRRHGVDAARLKPSGKGADSPVAPNTTDEGRAKNRRVELVKIS